MKVIDLLNKISNGEDVPKRIKINDLSIPPIYRELTFDKDLNLYINCDEQEFTSVLDNYHLNYEIEIIEDKKIDKLNEHIFVDDYSIVLKINEIIDKVNKL